MAQINSCELAAIPFLALVSDTFIKNNNDMIYPKLRHGSISSFDFKYFTPTETDSAELIVINTYSCLPCSFFKQIPSHTHLLIYVHNANGFLPFLGWLSLDKLAYAAFYSIKSLSFFSFLTSLYRFIAEFKIHMSFFHRKNVTFAVMHQNMINYIISRSRISQKSVQFAPFRILDNIESLNKKTYDSVKLTHLKKIVTLGNLDSSRRRFEDGFRLVSLLSQIGLDIEWHLVGKITDKRTRVVLNSLKKKYDLNPIFHGSTERVSTYAARKIISEMDFILPLHKRFLRFGCFVEEYSQSKASGVEYDSMYYNKYSLLPIWYKPSEHLSGFCISYSSIKSLQNWLADYYQNKTSFADLPCPSAISASSKLSNTFINLIISLLQYK